MKRSIVLLLVTMLLALSAPAPALAYTWSVERWRPVVRAQMEDLKIPAAERPWLEQAAMRCISRESGGIETARGGQHVGLLQYNRRWVKRSRTDWRWSGPESIRRFVKAYKQGGKRNIRRHWRATVGSG